MQDVDKLVALYESNRFRIERFMESVKSFFEKTPELHHGPLHDVHSVKARMKSVEHFRDKLQRKQGRDINEGNLFQEITDFAGVRVLHIHQKQFANIHAAINKQLEEKEWVLGESPVAYSWDPEAKSFFEQLGIKTTIKETFYTSVHYLLKPNADSPVCCEVQVRTLFEEIWGEIDHAINYPHAIDNLACTEELRVLSKFISTGTRLADAIFKTYEETQKAVKNDDH